MPNFSRFTTTAVPPSIRSQLESLLASWKSKRVDGLTVAEFVDFSREFLATAMSIVDVLADDATKKALVLEVAGELFDYFAPLIVIALPWYLKWLAYFFRAGAKEQFLVAVSNLIEIIYHAKFAPKVNP